MKTMTVDITFHADDAVVLKRFNALTKEGSCYEDFHRVDEIDEIDDYIINDITEDLFNEALELDLSIKVKGGKICIDDGFNPDDLGT